MLSRDTGAQPSGGSPFLYPEISHGEETEGPQGRSQILMPAGRPDEYTQGMADEICERLAEGESLRAICRDDDMPSKATVFRWLRVHDGFSDQYARARETQADTLFDDVLDIADDARNDWMERNGDDDQGWQVNGEHVQRTRLRIDARKWMAGKLRPKKYGEKHQLEHSGPDGEPIQTIERVIVKAPDQDA